MLFKYGELNGHRTAVAYLETLVDHLLGRIEERNRHLVAGTRMEPRSS
jgi:hypothetical protein